MVIVRSPAELNTVHSHEVRVLIADRIQMLSEAEPYDPDVFGYFVVLEPSDSIKPLDQVLGFSILMNRMDGSCFGEADFKPSFELIEEHAGWYEMVFVLSNDGFGVEVFVPKTDSIDARLISLCQAYAIPAREGT